MHWTFYPALLLLALSPKLVSACTIEEITAYKYVDGSVTWTCTAMAEGTGVSCVAKSIPLEFALDPETDTYKAIMDLGREDLPVQEFELPLDPQSCTFMDGTVTITNRGPAQRTPYFFSLGKPVALAPVEGVASRYDSLFYEAAGLTFRRVNDCTEVAGTYGRPSQFGVLLRGEGYDGSENFACGLERFGHRVLGVSIQETPTLPRAIVHLELASRETVIFEAGITHSDPFEVYAFMSSDGARLAAWRRNLGEMDGSVLAVSRVSDTRPFDTLGMSRSIILGLIGQSPESLGMIGVETGITPVGPSSVQAKAAVTRAIRAARPELASDDGYALRYDTLTNGRGDVGLRLEDFGVVSCTQAGQGYTCEFQTRSVIPYRFTDAERQMLSFLGLDPDKRHEPLSTYITADFVEGADGAWTVTLNNAALLSLGVYHEPVAERMAPPQNSSGPSAIDCAGSALMPAYVGAMRGC